MKRSAAVFNLFLLLLLTAGAGCGSVAHSFGKKATILRLHIEAQPSPIGSTTEIAVYRVSPIRVSIEKSPILDEGSLESAELVDDQGTHQLRLKFTSHGRQMLDTYTTLNRSRRIFIFCSFGEHRWLGGPPAGRITDGILTFTPDATREECARILRGLNDVATEVKRQDILQ